MFIDIEDLSKESQEELFEYAEEHGMTEEDVIDLFNQEAEDSANALDFFDDDIFLENLLRDDSGLLDDYLEFIRRKIERVIFRDYLVRKKNK